MRLLRHRSERFMNNNLKLAIFLNYFCIIITNLSSVLLTPILIGGLGQSSYGVYILVFSTILYLAMSTEFGIGNIVISHVSRYRVMGDKKSGENFLFVSLVSFAALAVIAAVVCLIFNANAETVFQKTLSRDPALIGAFKNMFGIMTINTFFTFFQTFFFCIITGYQKFIFTRTVMIIRLIARTAMIVFFMANKMEAAWIYRMELTFTVITTAIFICYSFFALKIRIKFHVFEKNSEGSYIRHIIWSYVYMVLDNIYWNIGNLFVGALISESDAGVFQIAMTFCIIFTQLSTTIAGYFIPQLTKLLIENATARALTDVMVTVGRVLAIILSFAVVGFSAIGHEFIELWIGKDFLPAYSITLIIFIVLIFPQVQIIGDAIVQAKDKYKGRSLISLCGTTLCAVTAFIFIKYFGLDLSFMGIAVSAVLFRLIVTSIYYSRQGILMKHFIKEVYIRLLAVFAASFVEIYGLNLLMKTPVFSSISQSGAGIALKALFITLFFALNIWFLYAKKDERDSVISVIKRKFKIRSKGLGQ